MLKTRMGRSFLACIFVSQPNFNSDWGFRIGFFVNSFDKTFGNKLKICVSCRYIC